MSVDTQDSVIAYDGEYPKHREPQDDSEWAKRWRFWHTDKRVDYYPGKLGPVDLATFKP